ncbi:hypothetical protein HPB50_004152 [Hyalomma asiaticum]|uniref:Uncharacterized protein n=1 Tax=Hyalomma asiaticum TaxID=266040 RepID=A0ACB7SEF3_HYAAI|nr:hypothetical protein HPB50_004152 [Hyalomma asiaticum]
MDSRLTHQLEAKAALFRRWKEQRHNRRLQQKISKLNKGAEEHCDTLCKQQWDELCESRRANQKWEVLAPSGGPLGRGQHQGQPETHSSLCPTRSYER